MCVTNTLKYTVNKKITFYSRPYSSDVIIKQRHLAPLLLANSYYWILVLSIIVEGFFYPVFPFRFCAGKLKYSATATIHNLPKWIMIFTFPLDAVYPTRALTTKSSKYQQTNKQTPWSESTNELYRPSDRRLSVKWLPTFADRVRHVVSVTDTYGRILGFLDRSRLFSSSSSSVVLTRLSVQNLRIEYYWCYSRLATSTALMITGNLNISADGYWWFKSYLEFHKNWWFCCTDICR
jgi:hypothetical protein